MSISQIVKGTINNVLNRNEDLYNERIKICKKCPLYKKDKILGEICNPALYINPINDKVSYVSQEGWIKGCGCFLQSKTREKTSVCYAGKW